MTRLLVALVLCGACASDKSHNGIAQNAPGGSAVASTAERSGSMSSSTPPATQAFRTYAASKLRIAESRVEGGPSTEQEASWFKERVGSVWAMTMFPRGQPQDAVRGWATPDGQVVTVDQNLGLLLAEAGVWGGGATPALTASELAERIVWSLGAGYAVFVNLSAGAPAPEIKLVAGTGTMTFVVDHREPGPGGAGGGPRRLTRFDIALSQPNRASVTRTPVPPR